MTSEINRRHFLEAGAGLVAAAVLGKNAIAQRRKRRTEYVCLVPMNQVQDTIHHKMIGGTLFFFVRWNGESRQMIGHHLDFYEEVRGRGHIIVHVDVWAKIGFRMDEVEEFYREAAMYAAEFNDSIVKAVNGDKAMLLSCGATLPLPKC